MGESSPAWGCSRDVGCLGSFEFGGVVVSVVLAGAKVRARARLGGKMKKKRGCKKVVCKYCSRV